MQEGAFNQEKALVGAFSVIVNTDCETDGPIYSTSHVSPLTAHGCVPVWVAVSVDADRAHMAAALPVLVTSICVDLHSGAVKVLQRKYSLHIKF